MNQRKTARPPAVLITGATSGIGAAFSDLFAKQGKPLVLASRSARRLTRQQQRIESRYGVSVLAITSDLSDPWSPEEIVEEINRRSRPVDTLVNNAGFNESGDFTDTNLGRELQMIQTHVGTLTSLTKRLLPPMLERGSGKILNVGSAGSLVPCPRNTVYCATKAFVLSFSEALYAELKDSGVTVTVLLPGATRSRFSSRAGIDERIRVADRGMDPQRVALIGYRALMRGRRRVVAGCHNRLMATVAPYMPRMVRERLGRFMWLDGSRPAWCQRLSA